MSKNIVFEGWLTKSPPSKRIWKTKWRRRWFALRQSGELPGQYFLDYYADRNRRRLKGSINLDFCEQVDAGLHMERGSTDAIDPKLRGSVFTIQTQTRTYHLEADCEADMAKWVDAICCVCGLRATDDNTDPSGIYQNHDVAISNRETIELRVIKENGPRVVTVRASRSVNNETDSRIKTGTEQQQPLLADESNNTTKNNEHNNTVESTGPYIPISECITGVRSQDVQNAFTFDPKNIVVSTKSQFEKPQIRINNVELSENESNFSEDECRSLNTSQPYIGDWTVAKTFTKLSIAPHRSNAPSEEGPPVPPRPPKTFAMSRDFSQKELLHKPKILEGEIHENATPYTRSRAGCHASQGTTPPSPGRSTMSHSIIRTTDDEDDASVSHSMQYCNLSSLPPAVDRALKPRHSSHSIGHVRLSEVTRRDTLQYLDLDFQHAPETIISNTQDNLRKSANIIHGKSYSSEDEPAYKTVDFLKTEAFNITRQDAEASRSNQQ